jgi:predicted MPP superfamily phosphohydrolase
MTRTWHILTFLGVFAAILTVSHFYLFMRLGHYLQLNMGQRRSLALLLGGMAVLTLVSLPITRLLPREFSTLLAWAVYPWMGIVLLMLVVMVATDLSWIVWNTSPLSAMEDPERRSFIQLAFGVVALGATGTLSIYSLWNGLRPVRIKPLSITLDRLPHSMDGLRIAQITDLHIGPMIDGGWLRHVVDQVNGLKPDLIVVTGDLVDGSVADLAPHVAPLAGLNAPKGVYFITGNHEYYSGVDEWCAHIATLGLRVLRNEHVSIMAGREDDSLDLAGVDDWGSRQLPGGGPDLTKALAGRDPNKPVILLAHQPAAIIEAAAHGVDLQLSGHTHGGQRWPFTYLVYLQQPYVEGLYRHNDRTQIYVSPGTGFWGPPMRFGTEAEITHITLRAAG